MRRVLGYLGLALLLASAFLLGASRLLPSLDAARWADTTETTGQIVGFAQSGTTQRPLICFLASSGEPYVFEADSFKPSMLKGQVVIVRYFLAPELRASLKPDFTSAQMWLGIIGCVLAAAALLSLFFQAREASLRRQLMNYGTRLNATVTSLVVKSSITVNGRHPTVITCAVHNPQGLGEWTFKSSWVWKLPPALQVGSTVPVLVDLYRPTQYCVLAEEAEPKQLDASQSVL